MNRPSETTHLVVLMTRLAVLTLSSPWHILVTSAYILLAHERVYSPAKLACRVFSARPVPVASITTARIRLLAVNHTPHTDIVSTSGRIWSPYRPGTLSKHDAYSELTPDLVSVVRDTLTMITTPRESLSDSKSLRDNVHASLLRHSHNS
ncbi:hypothetical protein AcV7_005562 [Taiwanofungus camphoratus]|nr:hypothetical protein AcV7_005562 [Antrodia cinnamomea]